MAKANAERGECQIKLAGKTYRLRPSHEAIRAIEEETGQPGLVLVRLSNRGELNYKQLGIIGAELIRAGAIEDDPLTRNVVADRIEELIFEEGVTEAIGVFTICLLNAVTGKVTASGEPKAAPAKP